MITQRHRMHREDIDPHKEKGTFKAITTHTNQQGRLHKVAARSRQKYSEKIHSTSSTTKNYFIHRACRSRRYFTRENTLTETRTDNRNLSQDSHKSTKENIGHVIPIHLNRFAQT